LGLAELFFARRFRGLPPLLFGIHSASEAGVICPIAAGCVIAAIKLLLATTLPLCDVDS
jgi:hypothetical protein